jgi:hypothetical protein
VSSVYYNYVYIPYRTSRCNVVSVFLLCLYPLQDLPLPRYLHVPNSSGRFNILQCRQALASLALLLGSWATFILAENHSYIKLILTKSVG